MSKLEVLRQNTYQVENRRKINIVEKEIDNMLIKKKICWKQQSRADLLEEVIKIPNSFTLKLHQERRIKSGESMMKIENGWMIIEM